MSIVSVAAVSFCGLALLAIAFQLALAAGAPWGAYAMAGRFPGTLPLSMRILAIFQACFLGALASLVVAHAGIISLGTPVRWPIWGVVLLSSISFVLNLVTPSRGERRVWAPVAFLMLVSSLTVAIGSRA